MGLGGKLDDWTDAGIITPDQKSRILEHEKNRNAHRWKNGLGMAGLFSVLLGIALIVAANWQGIAWQVKLGAHFAINACLTVLVWRWRHDPARDAHREVALFLLWGLTLTLIALIGQVFQLGGHAYTALRLWFWITAPMILLFAQSRFTARLWALAFMIYIPYDILAATWDYTHDWTIRKAVLLGTGTLLPLGAWLVSIWPRFAVNRPSMADTMRRLALLIALIGASVAGVQFYATQLLGDPLIAVAFAAFAVLARLALRTRIHGAGDRITLDLLCLSALFICLPFIAPVKSELMAMLHFVAFWILAGTLWHAQDEPRLVSLAIYLIALRLFVGFLQLFGSMMFSGVGFIIIGLVLMGLVRGARWFDRRLKPAQTQGAPS